jgi:serine protein kinase
MVPNAEPANAGGEPESGDTPANDNPSKKFSNLFEEYQSYCEREEGKEYTLKEYLELCKEDPEAYAPPSDRLLKAIGKAEVIDTSKDPRLSRIFQNTTIRQYPAFEEFYGMEKPIMKLVDHLTAASQGLEEAKQVLYLLGPPGGGKSTMVECLKSIMEDVPFYALKYVGPNGDKNEMSPLHENPLGLFDAKKFGNRFEEEYNIPKRALRPIASPWAVKRLKECGNDLNCFRVVKVYPSIKDQVAIAKTEPGDDNNQDTSALIGKVDIRKLEEFSQNDPDAYSFCGGLNKGNRGIMDFVEMFKAPIKTLNPLLTATQEGHFNGTEPIGAMPFEGIIVAHSNESEWQDFRNSATNEAFLDRVNLIRFPYNLRVSEEVKIYEKLINDSAMKGKPCAPDTLEMLARFSILTRIKPTEKSSDFVKVRVYDGETLKDKDPRAKPISEYKEDAGITEGMDGTSPRFAFKVLSQTFNFDANEIAADPVHLMYVLQKQIKDEQFPAQQEERYLNFIQEILAPKYLSFLAKEIQTAYLESYSEFGQNLFERYIKYADCWLEDNEHKDPDTGNMLDKEALEKELQEIEKPYGVSNPKDFRQEVVTAVYRAQAKNGGDMPDWRSYKKLKDVIEHRMFSKTEDLMPVISFGAKSSSELEEKHNSFVSRMQERGYTKRQVKRVVDWYARNLKNG